MELVKLFKALADAASLKAAFALLGAYLVELLGPALEFVVFGTLILVFEMVTGVLANIKDSKQATNNAAAVMFKLTLYPLSVFMVALLQYQWVPIMPLVEITSGYIVVHEFEQSMSNVSRLTGWQLTGPVALIKEEMKKRGLMK